MTQGLDERELQDACLELARVVLAAGLPEVSNDILETLADRFHREVIDFAPGIARAASLVPERHRARTREAMRSRVLLRQPAPVHVPGHAADLVGPRRAQEHGERPELVGRDELERRLLLAQQRDLRLLDRDLLLGGA